LASRWAVDSGRDGLGEGLRERNELDDGGKLIRWRDYTDPAAISAIHH